MITFHPRTVSQGYSGNVDWNLIKELKEISNLPIVGNGDVTTPEEAKTMLDETGCDYVMIGRGAMGNPSYLNKSMIILKPTLIMNIHLRIDWTHFLNILI